MWRLGARGQQDRDGSANSRHRAREHSAGRHHGGRHGPPGRTDDSASDDPGASRHTAHHAHHWSRYFSSRGYRSSHCYWPPRCYWPLDQPTRHYGSAHYSSSGSRHHSRGTQADDGGRVGTEFTSVEPVPVGLGAPGRLGSRQPGHRAGGRQPSRSVCPFFPRLPHVRGAVPGVQQPSRQHCIELRLPGRERPPVAHRQHVPPGLGGDRGCPGELRGKSFVQGPA
jgi:hypothetical protein